MNYPNYSTEDFLLDERFIAWVKQGENDAFWQGFVAVHPEKQTAVHQARAIILATAQLPVQPLSEQTQGAMWNYIQERMHEDTTPIRRIGQPWWWVAAASVVLVASWLSYQYLLPASQGISYETLVKEATISTNQLIEVVNQKTVPQLVNLPDGSSVLLQKDSRLSFAKRFLEDNNRSVYLSGEAFFEVKKNPEKPFLVYANELITKVLGTSFTINAPAHDKWVRVIVKTGRVSVFTQRDADKKQKLGNRELDGIVLTPNQQITLNRTELRFSKTLVPEPELLTLSAERLSFDFDDTPVIQIFETIEKAYGVEIAYDEELLKKCHLTASLSDEPLYDKIRLICTGLNAHYEVIDGQIIIHAKACE